MHVPLHHAAIECMHAFWYNCLFFNHFNQSFFFVFWSPKYFTYIARCHHGIDRIRLAIYSKISDSHKFGILCKEYIYIELKKWQVSLKITEN